MHLHISKNMIASIMKRCFQDGVLGLHTIHVSIILNLMLSKICYMSIDSTRILSVKSNSRDVAIVREDFFIVGARSPEALSIPDFK